jgi:magnesium transporter
LRCPTNWTVGHVIDYLRAADTLTTDFWEVFVVDERHHPGRHLPC